MNEGKIRVMLFANCHPNGSKIFEIWPTQVQQLIGECLREQGERCKHLLVITAGREQIVGKWDTGEECATRTLGELACLCGLPQSPFCFFPDSMGSHYVHNGFSAQLAGQKVIDTKEFPDAKYIVITDLDQTQVLGTMVDGKYVRQPPREAYEHCAHLLPGELLKAAGLPGLAETETAAVGA